MVDIERLELTLYSLMWGIVADQIKVHGKESESYALGYKRTIPDFPTLIFDSEQSGLESDGAVDDKIVFDIDRKQDAWTVYEDDRRCRYPFHFPAFGCIWVTICDEGRACSEKCITIVSVPATEVDTQILGHSIPHYDVARVEKWKIWFDGCKVDKQHEPIGIPGPVKASNDEMAVEE
eukprot:GEMP01018423.1.p1 GENE.GEMP01018423.1~~GEMP01018423.1.p1  ORF type:complete len:178 (+),score=16.64 GEMP01018423.1:70-603(+)